MFVLVNLKAYDCDHRAVADAAAGVTDAGEHRVAVAPQAAHVGDLSATGAEVWSQHVSPSGRGSHTGSTNAAAIAGAGAVGTILNHSERRLRLADIDRALERAREAGLETVVCANTPRQVAAVAALGPDAVAIEPPALIGTGTPVSRADPEIVSSAVEAAAGVDPSIDVLCGAGIGSGEDVAAARELGATGVLVASGVAKAVDPRAAIEDLVSSV